MENFALYRDISERFDRLTNPPISANVQTVASLIRVAKRELRAGLYTASHTVASVVGFYA
jgi:hypothetical protein